MPDTDTPGIDQQVLPLLPLTTGVVLPGMVVTLTLESDDARGAAAAAASTDDALLLLVPRVEGSYARVGTIAKIEELGQTRSGVEALVIRGIARAVVGVGVPGTGEAVWVQVEPVDEGEPTPRARELAREYRAVIENIVEARGVPQVAEFLDRLPDQVRFTPGVSDVLPEISAGLRSFPVAEDGPQLVSSVSGRIIDQLPTLTSCDNLVIATPLGKATGIFFAEPTVDCLAEAIRAFERTEFDECSIRMNAERFTEARFHEGMLREIVALLSRGVAGAPEPLAAV